jgi:hypothetical protein
MNLFLTGFALGIMCAVPVVLYLDKRFVLRHMLLVLLGALGFGLIIPSEDTSSSMQALGFMAVVYAVGIWFKMEDQHKKKASGA